MQSIEKKKDTAGRIALSAPKKAWVLQHVAFEDVGIFEPLLQARGFHLHFLEAGVDDLDLLDPLVPELLVVLGGPIGVYEQERYPYLQTEIEWLRKRVLAERPTLGICLGSQLIAHALGARVYPGPVKEIGWAPLTLTSQGQIAFMQHLATRDTPVLHWHGDVFDLPEKAIPLAGSQYTQYQAFSYADHQVLGLLFHPEINPSCIERWLIGHAVEIANTPGLDIHTLRTDSKHYGEASVAQGKAFFQDWLNLVLP